MKPNEIGIRGFLLHMYQETTFITEYLTRITIEEYSEKIECRYALSRSLEIIGEAVKHIPETYRAEHPEIPWKAIAGNRDTLIHGYFIVDYDVVWDTVTNDVPQLRKQLEELLKE